ncbi:MAG: hypothetical protein R6U04_01465 [Bacteroidales bacterium]
MKSDNFLPKALLSFLIVLLLPALTSFAGETISSEDSSSNQSDKQKLYVYLDLEYWADEDFIKQEIPVVEFVRDKEFADVHIIMSRHAAGKAGTHYILSFIGRKIYAGMNNDLRYWSEGSETDYEIREGYTRMIKIGLASYIASIDEKGESISLNYQINDTTDTLNGTTEEEEDPWRRWIFEIYGGGYFDSEQTRNSTHIRYGFYADKVTEDWKIRARPYFNYNERNYDIEDSTVTTITHRDGFHGYLIKSISEHWSAGVFNNMLSSTFHNMDFQIEVSPAIEYSLFPYSEATKRSIAVAYKIDYSYNDYIQKTVFGKNKESLWGHSLVLSADFRQPWGSIEAGITGSQHFHDFNSNSVELFSQLDIRLFKGFSLTLEADFEFINDLVAIPMKEMSAEEILLEQRRRSTDYQFNGHIGFTYTFGSDASAGFNPRL